MEIAITEELTTQEKQLATDDLTRTHDELLQEIRSVTEEQWHFKPSADVWSVAENAEHIILVEGFAKQRLLAMKGSALAEPGRDEEAIVAMIRAEVPRRTTRVQTPPAAQPSGTWTLADTISRFEDARKGTIASLDQPLCFHGRVQVHPVLGPWDGYEWILAVAGHCARHTEQIRELKSDPAFPKA